MHIIITIFALRVHNIFPTKKQRLSGKPNNFHEGLANSVVIILLLSYQKLSQERIQ